MDIFLSKKVCTNIVEDLKKLFSTDSKLYIKESLEFINEILVYQIRNPRLSYYTGLKALCFVPFSRDIYRSIYPRLFDSRYGDKGLDILIQNKIIEYKKHDRHSGLCREYRICPEKLEGWLKVSSPNFMKLKAAFKKKATVYTADSISAFYDKGKHTISGKSSLYSAAYSKLSPVYVDSRVLFDTNLTDLEKLYAGRLFAHMKKYGYNKINHIWYYVPKYKVAKIGSRSFEKQGGFQFMPSSLKWKLFYGINYDIIACQYNILLFLFNKYSLPTKYLCRLNTDNMNKYFIKNDLNLNKDVLKTLLYATIFCLGKIPITNHSNVFKELYKTINDYDLTLKVLTQWNSYINILTPHFDKLVEILWSNGTNTIQGRSVYNSMGGVFHIKGANKQTVLSKKQKRQLLAHVIQGIESEAVIINVLNNPSNRVSSLEHDGFVAMNYIEWQHPFLKIDIKHIKPLDI